ncbi:hypothetical protein GCM10011326_10450 [Salipiger profundus]|jgi:hypothetical protein|uniref:Uncharacterized protein n=2 Tax=Roseobacteraceae TaxID=2854170 RepID=A0A1U7D0J5_9RHOB|nr:hypothetical protein Ga0080559_TMP814 [Salipiger profundus]GGA01131.1 hypothetical protein GCM10011326_10450 [Salipiger profundus]SFC13524.1 hypothetical protein SAMN05444415_102201 [Salipiger profundus]
MNMPRLVRLYILQTLMGFGLSTVFVGLLLWQNVANLYHLVTSTDAGLLAVFLLWLFNGLVFAGAQFAISIMRMQDTDTPPSGGKRAPTVTMQPVPVRVAAERPKDRAHLLHRRR